MKKSALTFVFLILTEGCVLKTGFNRNQEDTSFVFVQVKEKVERSLFKGNPYNYEEITTVDPLTNESTTTVYPGNAPISASGSVTSHKYVSTCIDYFPKPAPLFKFENRTLRGCFDEFDNNKHFRGILASPEKLFPMTEIPFSTTMFGNTLTIQRLEQDGTICGTFGTNSFTVTFGEKISCKEQYVISEDYGETREWEIKVTYTIINHGLLGEQNLVLFDPHYTSLKK